MFPEPWKRQKKIKNDNYANENKIFHCCNRYKICRTCVHVNTHINRIIRSVLLPVGSSVVSSRLSSVPEVTMASVAMVIPWLIIVTSLVVDMSSSSPGDSVVGSVNVALLVIDDCANRVKSCPVTSLVVDVASSSGAVVDVYTAVVNVSSVVAGSVSTDVKRMVV